MRTRTRRVAAALLCALAARLLLQRLLDERLCQVIALALGRHVRQRQARGHRGVARANAADAVVGTAAR
jgi:hypothetical protein